VKDRLFSGADVEEALASAAASLGLPMATLRYVVLDAGSAGGRGLQPTPARIAVLIHEPQPGSARSHAVTEGHESTQVPPRTPATDPREGLQALVRAIAEAGAFEVEARIEESEDALVLQLRGRDSSFFLGEDGRGEPLFALEHLAHRMYGQSLYPRALRVRCEGFRERRDQALAEDAHRLAVRADGQPRSLPPLNAYERRIVHLALHDAPGVTTYSIGEGRDRRVRVAPKTEAEVGPLGALSETPDPGGDADAH
jgi:spoIIIJ-associated protein